MKFHKADFEGVWIIEQERNRDARGFFTRVWCHNEFEKQGINFDPIQTNLAYSQKKSTLRGMHFQKFPYLEAKIVSCLRGEMYDVIIDLRTESPTFKKWMSIILSEENGKMLYIPEGFAHGFQTLTDDVETLYHMSVAFVPEFAVGVRWNDPTFGIDWPSTQNRMISDRDQNWPDFSTMMSQIGEFNATV